MGLPEIRKQYFTHTLLSSGRDIKYRAFTLGEQKLVLLVKETKKTDVDVYKAVLNMVKDCCEGVNVSDLFPIEFESLFYDIRGVAEGHTIDFQMECQNPDCKHMNSYAVNTEKEFYLKNEKNFFKKIMIKDEEMIIKFRQPKIKDVLSVEQKTYPSDEIKSLDMMVYCLDEIVHKESVHQEFSYDDANKFINSLPDAYLKELVTFFTEQPALVFRERTEKCEKCQTEITFTEKDTRSFFQ